MRLRHDGQPDRRQFNKGRNRPKYAAHVLAWKNWQHRDEINAKLYAARRTEVGTRDRGDELHQLSCDADDRLRSNLGGGSSWHRARRGAP